MSKIKNWFKRLRVSEKLALISIFFVMPDSVMLYLFITGINANLQFAEQEKKGNAYQRPLEVLLELIPEHELLAKQMLAARKSLSDEVEQQQRQIDAAFRDLEKVDARLGQDLQFTDEGLAKRKREQFRPRLMHEQWVKLKTDLPTLNYAGLTERHLALVNGMRTMITHAGDLSNLILDPDLDSYYLMDTTLLTLPQAQERLSAVMESGWAALRRGSLTPEARQQLAINARLMREADIDRAAGSLQTALNEDKNFYGVSNTLQERVPGELARFVSAAKAFAELTAQLSLSETATVSAEHYLEMGRDARQASFRLWRVASAEVDNLLETRIAWYKARRAKSLAVAGLALLAAIGFVTFITRSISGPLTQQTNDLRSANEALQAEISERKRIEADLRKSEAQLAIAQKIAGIGSWEWDLVTQDLTWSDENYRIHGVNPENFRPTYEVALDLVHSSDRSRSDSLFKKAINDRKTFSFEQRIIASDGHERILHQRGDILLDLSGAPIRMVGTAQDVTDRRKSEQELKRTNEELLAATRQAGMAEVATGVLHNVGNVLNSVNVSAMLLSDRLRKSKITHLSSASQLMKQNEKGLAQFFTQDPKGKLLPSFIHSVVERVNVEQAEMLREVEGLTKNIGHIKDIVSVQQSYAKVSGVVETLPAAGLLDDALHMNEIGFERHGVTIIRDFEDVPAVRVDKHKILQVLVNLLRNAKQAIQENALGNKTIRLAIKSAADKVKISVEDNGVGIPKENLARIFAHGFTTKREGHGFGLHSAALAAAEMGGSLIASSNGTNQGATFTLELPVDKQNRN